MNFKFKNIGMIKEGDININKLTIIAGQNDSGKSTIGKALFATINGNINLEKTLIFFKKQSIKQYLKDIESRLKVNKVWKDKNIDDKDIFSTKFDNDILNKRTLNYSYIKEFNDIEKKILDGDVNGLKELDNYVLSYLDIDEVKGFLDKVKKIFEFTENSDHILIFTLAGSFFLEFKNQINNIFINNSTKIELNIGDNNYVNLDISNNNNDFKIKNFQKIFIKDIAYIEGGEIFNDLYNLNLLSDEFKNSLRDRVVNLKEKIKYFYSKKDENILETILNSEKKKEFEKTLNSTIDGVFKYSEKSKSFVLEKNGTEILIQNVAMGIKSIAIINILLSIDLFKQDNVLIIDEPEIHLHPKWQIEYAKIITTLSKVFNVKVLVITHSPYIIEAFQKFSELYDISKDTNFYLLKRDGDCSNVLNVNSNIEAIYDELGSAYSDLDNYTLRDL